MGSLLTPDCKLPLQRPRILILGTQTNRAQEPSEGSQGHPRPLPRDTVDALETEPMAVS